MGKSKKRPASPSPEQEVFHVEVITQARVAPISSDEEDSDDDSDTGKKKKDRKGKGKPNQKKKPAGKWEYLVKWAGYGSDADSWEPESNVAGCQRLLASFWDHVGTDNKDYSINHTIKAKEKWIKKEKNYFATEFNNEQERIRLRREKEERERTAKRKKRRKISPSIDLMTQRPVASSSQHKASDHSNDDEPLRIRISRKRLRAHSSDEDMDTPPQKMMKMDHAMTHDKDQDQARQNAAERPKILLPRRSESTSTSYTHTTQGQQAGEKKTTDEQTNSSHSPTSLFSAPSPEGPLTNTASPAPDKPAPSSAKVAPPSLPKIPRRVPTNPHNKLLGMAPSKHASGSGISTKQRLAQGALNPTNPRDVGSAAVAGRPLVPQLKTPANSLMNLSFKKKAQAPTQSPIGGPDVDHRDSIDMQPPVVREVDRRNSVNMQPPVERRDPTLAALNASSTSRPSASMSPMMMSADMPYTASPDHYTMSDHPPEMFMTDGTHLSRRRQPRVEDPYMAQAESFLQNIMPDELAAPLPSPIERPFEPVPPRPLVKPKIPLPKQRIQKKWSWSGCVYIDAAGGRSEPLCNATLLDATENTGMRFSIAMGSMDHLDFPGFHNILDLNAILRACNPPLQYARLAPKEEAKDGKAMITLAKNMVKKQTVILVPVSMDNNVIAHIVFFPHVIASLCRRFKVPPDLHVAGSLVAVLVPFASSPAQLSRDWRKPPSVYLPAKTSMEPMIADKARWERSIRTKPVYQRAIRMLRFPSWLHEYMSAAEHSRSFCVWWETGDVKKKKAAMETMFLYSIMEQCRARHPSSSSPDVRVVFVHVGALKTIHKFPFFVERCSKLPQVQFYTYGTHESIPPEEWGVREIYPCGGVVTFTPGAILEDPIGVLHKIRQIQSHPLWMCYILPSVLGMVAKLHCENEDPLVVFDSGRFPYHYLLTAIEEGDLALICAPPRDRTPALSKDRCQEWIRDYWSCRPRSARAMLETSFAAFSTKYSNIQSSEWASEIELEISRDVSAMQRHPAIMVQHRRYVVFRSERTRRTSSSRDGLEWTAPAKFDFRDDFFPKQT